MGIYLFRKEIGPYEPRADYHLLRPLNYCGHRRVCLLRIRLVWTTEAAAPGHHGVHAAAHYPIELGGPAHILCLCHAGLIYLGCL